MYQFHPYVYFAVITAESYQNLTKVFKIIVATPVQFFEHTTSKPIDTHSGFDTRVGMSNSGTSV